MGIKMETIEKIENQKFTIDSEETAFSLLDKLNKNEAHITGIEFLNWPILSVKYDREDGRFDSTITSRIAEYIVDLQNSLDRSYAFLKYGKHGANNLTDDDKKSTQVFVKIGKGSSNANGAIDYFFSKLPDAIANGINKMTPEQIFTLCIVAALTYGSVTILKHFISKRSETKIATEKDEKAKEKEVERDKQETERMKIYTDAINKNSEISNKVRIIEEYAEELKMSTLKSAVDADTSIVQGIQLNRSDVQEIIRNEREFSTATRCDGLYHIVKIENQQFPILRVSVESLDGDVCGSSSINSHSFGLEKISLLSASLTNKTPIQLIVNARKKESSGIVTAIDIADVLEMPEPLPPN